MPSPVSFSHAGPHADVTAWLGVFRAMTPGTDMGDNASVRLDDDNEPQPDCVLFIDPSCAGQVSLGEEDLLEGAPELAVEVASSSVSIDLGGGVVVVAVVLDHPHHRRRGVGCAAAGQRGRHRWARRWRGDEQVVVRVVGVIDDPPLDEVDQIVDRRRFVVGHGAPPGGDCTGWTR